MNNKIKNIFLHRNFNEYNKNSDAKKGGRGKLVFPVAERLKPQGFKEHNVRAERALMFTFSPLLSIIGVLFASSAKAVCPVCTIAVCAGVGLSRWLKIDDSITGIWLGGFIVSMIIWTLAWFNKKNIHFKGKKLIIIGAFYLFVLLPLLYKDMLGQPLNKLWGMDKLGLGIVIGSIGFSLGVGLHNYLKKKNQGKSYFIYQKVALPIAPLIVLTVVFYILTKFCF